MRRLPALSLMLVLLLAAPWAGAGAPDYRSWDGVLVRNVRNGFVDYDGIKADPAFNRFITQLGTTRAEDLADRSARLAFYINAYNALAIKGILDGDSPDSLLGRNSFFRRRTYSVLGESVTLDQLEKNRLAAFAEPRVHFAIVCASLSCPRLANRVYLPGTVELQLDAAARAFVNDPTRNRFDQPRRVGFLSAIFDWYRADFAGAAGSLPRYLARYVKEPAVAEALAADRYQLRFVPYDWNLNGVYRAKP